MQQIFAIILMAMLVMFHCFVASSYKDDLRELKEDIASSKVIEVKDMRYTCSPVEVKEWKTIK